MSVVKIILRCPRCDIEWTPVVERPKCCPNCKLYETPKRQFIVVSLEGRLPAKRLAPRPYLLSGHLVKDRYLRCSFCGHLVKRAIAVDFKVYCRDCIYRLLSEEEPLL